MTHYLCLCSGVGYSLKRLTTAVIFDFNVTPTLYSFVWTTWHNLVEKRKKKKKWVSSRTEKGGGVAGGGWLWGGGRLGRGWQSSKSE